VRFEKMMEERRKRTIIDEWEGNKGGEEMSLTKKQPKLRTPATIITK
jgi:hypothetical protein